MRIYIYSIPSFPLNISVHVGRNSSPSQVLSEAKALLSDPYITAIFDSRGNPLEDLTGHLHGSIYFASIEDKLPDDFSSCVAQAHMDRVKILTKKELKLDIVEMTILGLITFYISWFLTNGGVLGALPLCGYLSYACFRKSPEKFRPTIKYNLSRIITTERKLIYVGAVWMTLKVAIENFLPQSNGTSPMLVLFSISLSLFFVLPRILTWWLILVRDRKLAPCYIFHPIKRHYYLSVLAVLCLVLLVLADPYFTSFFTLALNKGQCGLLLTSQSEYMENTMNKLRGFSQSINLNQFNAFDSLLKFSTGLGEVDRILPVLVTLAIFAQLIVPKQYELLRHLFFRTVLGQVVGGLISAGVKITVHRFRPVAYGDPLWFGGPGLQTVNHLEFSKLDLSFPCGHATVTFATCYILYKGILAFINNNRPNYNLSIVMRLAIGAAIFIFPAFTGLSRVADCLHWTSDVFAGFLLGVCVGSWSVGKNFDMLEEVSDSLSEKAKYKIVVQSLF